MARPFLNTFENDSSMSSQAGANTPISYRANVNRQKTKKWTTAAAVDYGGDDWGDDDEYDYDPSPPPVPKPTGLRQQGQALPATNAQRVEQQKPPPVDNSKKAYGDLPALPGASNSRGRSNSFDEDEERNFSNATIRQEPPSAATFPIVKGQQRPATRFSQITGAPSTRVSSGAASPPSIATQGQQPPKTGLRKASQTFSPASESPLQSPASQPVRRSTGEVTSASPPPSSTVSSGSDNHGPPGDYQARRDFSPSAVPQPLSTRASPAPQSAVDPAPALGNFPARKSSLGQSSAPNLADIMQPSQGSGSQKPWTANRSTSPGAAGRYSAVEASTPSSSTASQSLPPDAATTPPQPAGKALPFIRPADIYKRIEAEREKARQSSESGRPSMDSIVGARTSDRSESPATRPLKEKSSYENLAGSFQQRASIEADEASDTGRRLMPMLEPVKERKSEYGFDGFNVEQTGQHATEHSDTVVGPGAARPISIDDEIPRTKSVSPKLPNLNRISGFGIDMFSNPGPENQDRSSSKPTETTFSQAGESTLHSQPSVGFRSVVHQAFDRTDDSSVPPTPASQTGSGVRRTDSESTGTGGISPIMSRVPSGATSETRNRDFATPSILEVVHEPSSPVGASASTSTPPLAEPASHQRQPVIRGFKPGHRRDISTPSPGNSPARSLDLTNAAANPQGQQAIVSDLSPTANHDRDIVQPHAPMAGSQSNLRPTIPGGWTSYASTETSNTAQSEGGRPDVAGTETHLNVDSRERDSGSDVNINPTTSKHSLPQSSLEASIAAVGLTQAAGGTLETAGGRNAEFEQSSAVPTITPGNDSLPTPDTAMAPGGSIYSKAGLDPRLLPKLEQVPSATQLRPDKPSPPASGVGLPDSRSQVLPTLSIDSHPEAVEHVAVTKSDSAKLTPEPSGPLRHDEARLSAQLGDSGIGSQGRESTYLPREYDNYWASTTEDQESAVAASRSAVESNTTNTSLGVIQPPIGTESQSLPIAPPTIGNASQGDNNPVVSRLQHRFSWERSSENVSKSHHDAMATQPLSSQEPPTSKADPHTLPSGSVIPEHIPDAVTGLAHLDNQVERPASPPTLIQPEDIQAGQGAEDLPPAATLGADDASHGASVAEEIDRRSLYPVSPAPLEDETSNRPPSTVSPLNSPAHPPVSSAGRIFAFKEIVEIKTQHERIRTFDETRHRYASMNSGLDDWVATLKAQHPEHADVTGLWAEGGLGPTKLAPAPAGAAQSQQPYYQQYLNASSPANTTSRPGPGALNTGGQQGFSPGGGNKITSQQVQAKGKELLHTAGVFGGKAGKAGKGLLAKGKSRLRGGGDKTDMPAKSSKADRRTSWGIPLTLSRSTGRQQQEIPVSKVNELPNTTRTSLQTFSSRLSTDQDGGSSGMSGALPHGSSPVLHRGESLALRETSDVEKSAIGVDSGDSLGATGSISRNQPSWEPAYEGSVAEPEKEDDRYYEQRNQHPSDPAPANHSANPVAPGGVIPASEEQLDNQQETRFYSSEEEEPSSSSDWVMVPPESDVNDGPAQAAPAATHLADISTTEEVSHLPLQDTPLADSPHPATTFYEPEPAPPATAPEPVSQQQSGTTSFLPPIRRTSTFGLSIGSRQRKPRFPIEDDEVSDLEAEDHVDHVPTENRAAMTTCGEGAAVAGVVSTATIESASEPPVQAEPQEVHYQDIPTVESGPSASEVLQQAVPQEVPYEQVPIVDTALSRPEVLQQAEPREIPYEPSHTPQNYSSEVQPMQTGSSGYNQPAIIPRPQRESSAAATRPQSIQPSIPQSRSSQDSWRPNIAPPHPNPPQNQFNDSRPPLPRNSWEPEMTRGASGSSQQPPQRPDDNWVGPPPPRPFEQPPSSAQRYPDLFRSDAGPDIRAADDDLPAHYYQQPIPHEVAFLPRQQTNEYQLPGVGPPVDEPRPGGSKRNSGFFRELSRGISNSTARERSGSRSREPPSASPARAFDSRGNEYADSIVASDDGRGHRNPSSFFGSLSRTSTTGLAPPQSRDSMVAHHSQSRTDLLASEPSPPSPEKKRFLFGDSKPKLNKLSRASTSVMPNNDPRKKKRFSGLGSLFGKSGTVTARSSLPPPLHPQPTRELSHDERQPIESPTFAPRASTAYRPGSNNWPNIQSSRTWANGSSSQPKALLAKFRQPQTTTTAPLPEARKDNKSGPRRTSAAGLLNGFIGRGSNQPEGERDDSSRSEGSQPPRQPQPLPRAQTYTELQEVEPVPAPAPPAQPQPFLDSDSSQGQVRHKPPRVRRPGREPQYDNVPIPGGYSLVRGQGAMSAPTDYDPRGLNRLQQVNPQYVMAQAGDPRQYYNSTSQPYPPQAPSADQYRYYAPSKGHPPRNDSFSQRDPPATQGDHSQHIDPPQPQVPQAQRQLEPTLNEPASRGRPEKIGTLRTFDGRSAPRRISREDLVARSPARTPDGQQAPYQLTIPSNHDGEGGHKEAPRPLQNEPAIDTNSRASSTPTGTEPQHDSIQRLQQPVIRHPGSPASYTVPDTVFSPVNPSAQDLPAPPPPKLQPPLNPQHHSSHSNSQSQNDSLNVSLDLDRSNTVQSKASQVSKLSGHPDERSEGLRVSTAEDKKIGVVRDPSPPSPIVTPERLESPVLPPDDMERGREENRGRAGNDLLTRTVVARGSSPNLYDASPRLPKAIGGHAVHGRDDLTVDTNLSAAAKAPDTTPTASASTPRAAESENTPTNRRRPREQEEKIVYHGDDSDIEVVEDEDIPVTMSATSYPGQEWNPYGMGAFDDGVD